MFLALYWGKAVAATPLSLFCIRLGFAALQIHKDKNQVGQYFIIRFYLLSCDFYGQLFLLNKLQIDTFHYNKKSRKKAESRKEHQTISKFLCKALKFIRTT